MRVLFGIHDPGIIDHANALSEQILETGAEVAYVPSTDRFSVDCLQTIPELALVGVDGDSVWQPNSSFDQTVFDAVFVQTPYDEQRDGLRREIGKAERLSYAGYGTPLSNWTRGHYDLDFYSRCRYLLASSDYAVSQHRKRGVGVENVRRTGDPLLFKVRAAVEQHRISPDSPNVLWLPHWTLDWFGSPGYSTWTTTVHDVLSVATLTDVSLTIRPHPLLRQTLEGSKQTPERDALRRLLNLPNVHLSTESFVVDLLRATAVLTDGVSVIAYSCAAGLPVAVCRRPDSPPFGHAGADIVNQCEVLGSTEERIEWLRKHSSSISQRDPLSAAAQSVYRWFPLKAESPGSSFIDWLAE